MDHYKHLPESPVAGYTLVHGPDGFNAMADSFEDAVTFTCRLDQQLAEIERLRKAAKLADEMYEQAATQANDYAADNAALRAEVERLREERRWIPVEEDLPELDAPVFLQQGKMVWIGCLNYCEDAEGICWCNSYGHVSISTSGAWQCDVAEWDDDYQPTHWHPFPQPLPAPPDAG